MASFTNELALLIGLGVGVDYALFIVTRYRQGLLRGLSGEDAVVEALDTSGRAVLFAGMIVCIAMLGMFALGVSFLYGVAIGTSIAVAFTVLAALTLLPALLGFFGTRVLRRRDRRALTEGKLRTSDESAGWARWAGLLQKRPALFAAVAAGVCCVLLAIPFLSMRLGSADSGSDPAGSTTRKAYDLLAKGFGPGYNGPLQLVAQVSGPAQRSGVRPRRAGRRGDARALSDRRARGSSPGGPRGCQVSGSPTSIRRVRRRMPRRPTCCTPFAIRWCRRPSAERACTCSSAGRPRSSTTSRTVLSRKLPLFMAIVIVPQLPAADGRVPQRGDPGRRRGDEPALGGGRVRRRHRRVPGRLVGASLLGIDKTGPIEAFVPVFMFAILFGLSMDYEVFLVTRIYEEWHRRRNNREAVTHGLAATGRTITAAAAIMVLVFGAFILGGERIIELFGVGLASAVLLDALIVRSVLVPALMIMIGDANWWLPGWLGRRLPHLRVEGASARAGVRRAPAEAVPEPSAG